MPFIHGLALFLEMVLFEPFKNNASLSCDAIFLPSAEWRLQRSFPVQWLPMESLIETPVPAC
jgi:hypothetical protein